MEPERTEANPTPAEPAANSAADHAVDSGADRGASWFGEAYEALRELADYFLAGERRDHTLQPTALVHEAFLRMGGRNHRWGDRRHFMAAAAGVMRAVLVDHARRRGSQKRGGGRSRVAIADVDATGGSDAIDLLDLDAALAELSTLHERQTRIVELRFFGGLTSAEIAEELDVSVRSVDGDWAMAKAWLARRLDGHGP